MKQGLKVLLDLGTLSKNGIQDLIIHLTRTYLVYFHIIAFLVFGHDSSQHRRMEKIPSSTDTK